MDETGQSRLSLRKLPVAEVQEMARRVLPQMVYDYYRGGADDELTLEDNCAAFRRIRLRPRVLVDVSSREHAIEALGEPLSLPLAVAPMAYHKLAHPEGELATVRGAGRARVAYCASTMSTTSIARIAEAADGPLWYQLYVVKDRGATREMIRRAADAGCSALVVTVDAPLLGRRRRDERNQFALPPGMQIENLAGLHVPGLPRGVEGSQLAEHFSRMMKPDLTWDDLEWIRSVGDLPLVLKGIMTAEDGRLAAESGVDAVIVSNHGGRQLDGTVATIDALPLVVAACADRVEVWLDGGVRSGTDMLKALAIGARLVLVGRPILWGLAIGGADGVYEVLQGFREEFDRALALAGCRSPADITSDLLEAPKAAA